VVYRRLVREQEEFVEVEGGQLWTATSGRGVPMVLCHGGPGGYDYLAPVAEMVEDLAEVHRFDQRGGGRSIAAGAWTVTALVSDMEALRQHWNHDQWLVGGHSWGAHLALFYALAHPERTLGLIFLTGTGIRWGSVPARRADRMRRLSAAEMDEVEQLERTLLDGAGEQARSRWRDLMWLTDFADRARAERLPRYEDYPLDQRVIEAFEMDWQSTLDGIEKGLSHLGVPALVLHGEADPIGEEGPREVADLLPQGRFVVLADVGHLPWLEHPHDLRHQLRFFVAGGGRTA
jgi:proline iminopeptidase